MENCTRFSYKGEGNICQESLVIDNIQKRKKERRKEGRKEGREEGKKEGREGGRKEGRKKDRKRNVTLRCLATLTVAVEWELDGSPPLYIV